MVTSKESAGYSDLVDLEQAAGLDHNTITKRRMRRTTGSTRRRFPWQPMVSLFVAALIWEYGLPLLTDNSLMPSIGEIFDAWLKMIEEGRLQPAIMVTFKAFLVGFAVAAVFGIAIGIASHYWPTLDYVIQPYITLFMSIPIIALVPILMMLFGYGMLTRVLVVFLGSFFVVVINVQAGLVSVRPEHVDLARAFNANAPQRFLKVAFPSSLPWLATGLRLGIARALKGTINAEVIIRSTGLGFLLLRYSETLDVASVLAVCATIVLLVICVMQLVNWLERRLLGWSS